MVKIREITYKNYGTCVELSNGLVDVCVTTDVGPRIIRYGFIGKENRCTRTRHAAAVKRGTCSTASTAQAARGIPTGGHRLWASPEALPRTYYPDNAPGGVQNQR